MNNTIAVFKNQINEFLADKEQLLMYAIFPLLALLQTRVMDLDYGVYPYQIISVFGAMFTASVMIMLLPAVIAEHRENGSLRFMVMSGIKPGSYLLGIGGFFLLMNMLVALFFAWLGEFTGSALGRFLLTMFLAFVCSTLVAAIIGILSKNRQKAMGLSLPIGMGVAFLPMFAGSIEPLHAIMDILYIGRINNMMVNVTNQVYYTDLLVVLANIIALLVIFVILFKKKGMN